MIKLVLDSQKAEKLNHKLLEEVNLELPSQSISSDEVLFIISTKDQAVVLKVLNDILDEENPIWFNTYDGEIKVYPSSCLYFQVSNNETALINDYYKSIIINHTLADIEEILSDLWFIRITKSEIVNLRKITYIRPLLNSKLEITLVGDIKLEVNRSYLKAFRLALKEKGGI